MAMFKKNLLTPILMMIVLLTTGAVSLFAEGQLSSRSSSYELNQLQQELQDATFPINGYFVHYNRQDPFGWIYLSANNRLLAKLDGMNEDGSFRWTILNDLFETFGRQDDHIFIGHPRNSLGYQKTIHGIVVDAQTGEPLSGVHVFVTNDNNEIIAETISDANGNFTLTIDNFNDNTNYSINFVKNGYRHSLGSISSDLVGSSNDTEIYFGTTPLVNEQNIVHGNIEGMVIDSTNGNPINDAVVKLYEGSYNTASNRRPLLETHTQNGRFYFTNIPAGTYTIVVSANGYLNNYRNITIDNEQEYAEISLSPQLVTNRGEELRIQLSWGETPRDLDSHLIFIKSNELQYHIYYAQKYAYFDPYYNRYIVYNYQVSNNEEDSNLQPVAFLDRDDTTSYGPETITIYHVDTNGIYKYFVHNYSGGSNFLSRSNATVKIITNEGVQRVFNVPNEPGILWKVFEIRYGQIVPCTTNCMFDIIPDSENLTTRSLQRYQDRLIKNLFKILPKKR